ncbi:glycosyltransferase family 4 protein [Thalassospira sp. MA62]|nr:glycosyltransferase family 4 protein [Thalassospira sp. MA62]
MQTLTIVVLTDTAKNDGGASKVAIQSALGLSKNGLRVIYVAGDRALPDRELVDSPVEIVRLNQPSISDPSDRSKAFITGLWNQAAARGLKRVLAPLDATTTVIHLHSWTKSLSTSVIPAIRQGGFPLVLSLHDYFSACPNGSFYDFARHTPCERKPLSLSCITCNCDSRHLSHKIWRITRQNIQRHIGHFPENVDAFIAVSNFSQRILEPFLPNETPIYRLNNPVECLRSEPATPATRQTILYIGRLTSAKGANLLAAAARDAGIRITFVGDGELKSSLEATYPEHTFTGWLDFQHIAQLLNQARALVLPSLSYETLGLTVLEAAARGLPAIVSDECAATDVVRHRENGLHFKSGDKTSLSQALLCLEDDGLVAKLGAAAYKHFWASPPTLEKHVEGLVGIYETMLAARTDEAKISSKR